MTNNVKTLITVEAADWATKAPLSDTDIYAPQFPVSLKRQYRVALPAEATSSPACMRSQYTLHVDVARNSSLKDDNGVVSVLMNDDIGVLMASTGRDLDQRQDKRLGDVGDPVSTTLALLLC